jgi:GWxTD domain-containing protein
MKKTALILSFLIAMVNAASAIEASVSFATFKSPDKNYVEVCYYFIGKSLRQVQVDSVNSQGAVEVTILFKKEGKVVLADKYRIKSAISVDPADFLDLHRYGLDNGTYQVEINMKDGNKETSTAVSNSTLTIQYDNTALAQSDIQLINSYKPDNSNHVMVKNGYYLQPVMFGFYDQSVKELTFYNEVYNADKAFKENYFFSCTIEKASDKNSDKPLLSTLKAKKPEAISVNLASIDISQIPSGNYKLVTSIRNRKNELISSKEVFFQRSNPAFDIKSSIVSDDALMNEFVGKMELEELRYGIKAIAMLAPEGDKGVINTILSGKDIMAHKRYLYLFWSKVSSVMAENSYDQYMFVAKACDKTYNNGYGYGFETDRGIIFLKYGRPSDVITVDNEMSAAPYEIWVYNKIEKTKQTNVKFLFYNPSLAANGHVLLHSNCRGEVTNSEWRRLLYKNSPNDVNATGTKVQDNFDRNADRIFSEN